MSDPAPRGGATVRPAPHLAHLLLHCEPADAPAIAGHLSLELTDQMLASATAGGWSALHLAPDEWLLIGEEQDAPRLSAAFDDAGTRWPLSLVDISDRALCFDIEGRGAEVLLAAGCPMDLSSRAFPPGRCTRTLFGKAMVMLWRTGPDAFRLEVARSFAPYVQELLAQAGRELD